MRTTSSVSVDRYIVDSLMPDLVGHDRRPSAFLLYLTLWSRTIALGHHEVRIALVDLAEATGLSKRTVQAAIVWLEYRRLVSVTRDSSTDVGTFSVKTTWGQRAR